MDVWYTASQVSTTDLARALRDPRLTWVYAERMEDTVLTRRDTLLGGQVPLDHWTHGRAFGLEMELAWWRQGSSAEARAIVVKGESPQGIEWKPFSTAEWEMQPPQEILLVGERDPNAPAGRPLWSTVRIPRYLEYPVGGSAQRVALVEQIYRRQGIVVASRLVEVKEAGHG